MAASTSARAGVGPGRPAILYDTAVKIVMARAMQEPWYFTVKVPLAREGTKTRARQIAAIYAVLEGLYPDASSDILIDL